jgi:hypothetical protein
VNANAVELTAEQAWVVADALRAGHFPWVLAITPPFSDHPTQAATEPSIRAQLLELGVMTADGAVIPAVRQWVTATCRTRRWLELRFVRGSADMLRGLVARRDGETVVALRSSGLVTFSTVEADDPESLVSALTAGLAGRPPAKFEEFSLPARVGARADEQLRSGTPLPDVIEFLGIPPSARAVVEAAYAPGRRYVEIVAGDHRDGHRVSTDVGVSIVDTHVGRVLVAPSKAFDGEWISTFTPGTPLAIATAVERLTATLPDGPWFPRVQLLRDFDSDQRTEHPPWHQTVS